MGKPLRVLSKHVIEYGNTCRFSYTFNELQHMLEDLGCSTYPDPCEDADEFNANVGEYKAALEILKNHKEEIANKVSFNDEIDSEKVMKHINRCFYDEFDMPPKTPIEKIEFIVDSMEKYLEEADTNDGYIYFAAF